MINPQAVSFEDGDEAFRHRPAGDDGGDDGGGDDIVGDEDRGAASSLSASRGRLLYVLASSVHPDSARRVRLLPASHPRGEERPLPAVQLHSGAQRPALSSRRAEDGQAGRVSRRGVDPPPARRLPSPFFLVVFSVAERMFYCRDRERGKRESGGGQRKTTKQDGRETEWMEDTRFSGLSVFSVAFRMFCWDRARLLSLFPSPSFVVSSPVLPSLFSLSCFPFRLPFSSVLPISLSLFHLSSS